MGAFLGALAGAGKAVGKAAMGRVKKKMQKRGFIGGGKTDQLPPYGIGADMSQSPNLGMTAGGVFNRKKKQAMGSNIDLGYK